VSVTRKAGEKDKKTRVHNARETKRAKNNVKKRKNEFLSQCPKAITEESEKGDGLQGARDVVLMGREVRLAAVPRVVMRN